MDRKRTSLNETLDDAPKIEDLKLQISPNYFKLNENSFTFCRYFVEKSTVTESFELLVLEKYESDQEFLQKIGLHMILKKNEFQN